MCPSLDVAEIENKRGCLFEQVEWTLVTRIHGHRKA